jgi:hypothetical protein
MGYFPLPLSYVVLLLCGSSLACNTEQELIKDKKVSGNHDGKGGIFRSFDDKQTAYRSAPLTLLPQDQGNESPACLDGSPYGIYFTPSSNSSNKKWTISIEGGGWCYDEVSCYYRSKMALGSSTQWNPTAGCGCMNVLPDGALDGDCNCIYMPYCDGASFSGYRPDPWHVPNSTNEELIFRGIKNFDATMNWAFRHGLNEATEFVLTGGSAGGLSTFLHADRIAASLAKEAPDCKRITAAPVVGYFLDHDNYLHNANNYTNRMAYIYTMQNLSFGGDGGLMEACEKAYPPEESYYCFMSPHMQKVIQTPFFVFNSKFDAWQLGNELQLQKWNTTAEKDAVLQYGEDFLEQFEPVAKEGKNGAMITSCICHGCPWNTLKVDDDTNLTSYQHYANWFYGQDTGANAIHIDSRSPNGGGAIVDPHCTPFPKN